VLPRALTPVLQHEIEPQEIDTAVGRRKIAFVEAPDGIRTEVMEILEDREEEAVRSA